MVTAHALAGWDEKARHLCGHLPPKPKPQPKEKTADTPQRRNPMKHLGGVPQNCQGHKRQGETEKLSQTGGG